MCVRFKKVDQRKEYVEAMRVLLPVLYQRMMAILSDHSVPSVSLQHHILKIFYSSMQVSQLVHVTACTCVWVCVRACVCACDCVHMCVCACDCVHMCVCVHVTVYTCVCVCQVQQYV